MTPYVCSLVLIDSLHNRIYQTAGTLTFTIYRLSQHPDVFKRLRAEILNKVGPSRRPTYDDLRDMKYLRAVLNGTTLLFLDKCYVLILYRNPPAVSRCVS